HVCLGGDFVARITRELPTIPSPADGLMPPGLELGSSIEGLAGPEDYPALVAALHERGWSGADVDALTHGNLFRVLPCALPAWAGVRGREEDRRRRHGSPTVRGARRRSRRPCHLTRRA